MLCCGRGAVGVMMKMMMMKRTRPKHRSEGCRSDDDDEEEGLSATDQTLRWGLQTHWRWNPAEEKLPNDSSSPLYFILVHSVFKLTFINSWISSARLSFCVCLHLPLVRSLSVKCHGGGDGGEGAEGGSSDCKLKKREMRRFCWRGLIGIQCMERKMKKPSRKSNHLHLEGIHQYSLWSDQIRVRYAHTLWLTIALSLSLSLSLSLCRKSRTEGLVLHSTMPL